MRKNKTVSLGILIFMLIGIISLFFGITGKINLSLQLKNYKSAKGTLVDQIIIPATISHNSIGTTSTTYISIYSYNVGGEVYKVQTDYSTTEIPKMGSTKTIKYNPDNPSESIISGLNSRDLLIVFGLGFTFLSFGFKKLGLDSM